MIDKIVKNVRGDMVIWGVVIILILYSILAVYSAVDHLVYTTQGVNMLLVKHTLMAFMGLIVMFLVHIVPVRYYKSLSVVLIWLVAFVLIYTLFFTKATNAANRWLPIPLLDFSIQPSDFAKIITIMLLSRNITMHQSDIGNFKKGVVPLLTPVVIICALILPANLSTAAILFFVSTIVMFLGGVKFKHLALIYGACALLFTLFLGVALLAIKLNILPPDNNITQRFTVWENRVAAFVSKDSDSQNADYQTEQAKIAIASGGFIGSGPGNSNQRVRLPNPENDYIYAIIIEEYGFLFGAIPVLLCYLILLHRVGKLVRKCERMFPALLAVGLVLLIVIQALINMGVVVGVLPVTGQPLPLVSKGGSSMLFSAISIGIILNVSKQIKIDAQNKELEVQNMDPIVSQEELESEIINPNKFV